MASLLAERGLFQHTPFRCSKVLQRCQPPGSSRHRPCCEAVHRRQVAIHLASRDLNLETCENDGAASIASTLPSQTLSRRSVAAAAATLGLLAPFNALAGKAAAVQQEGFAEYINNKQGYRIDRPSSWEQTSKAGADVLFADPLKKSSTVGVTVNPIKIAGLEQFGDVETVRKRLINTEKQKESTKDVTLISESSRKGKSGTLIYDIEYELDSTRGRKRILSTVGIAKKKLFIVNGNIKCDATGCSADDRDILLLRQVASTFDVV